ncbi:hypothetical protein CCACVL1_05095 [Corchorus capsularis]|uniref:Uncharacterized protein n=1 Tax=Corchorus capsularis TaxID=210143 RepID=A0A1R3JMK6_COCAP|nr:hypothetical protein CCACVL1_05095 [Corchorus capsularis]
MSKFLRCQGVELFLHYLSLESLVGSGYMELLTVSTVFDGGHRAIVFNRIKGIKDEVKIGLRVLTRPDAAKLPTIY